MKTAPPVSITEHWRWHELRAFVRVETYDRDGGHTHPRHRFEVVVRDLEPATVRWLLDLEVMCVACGRRIHPVRRRVNSSQNPYLAVTCMLSERLGCARSGAAAGEYTRIFQALQ